MLSLLGQVAYGARVSRDHHTYKAVDEVYDLRFLRDGSIEFIDQDGKKLHLQDGQWVYEDGVLYIHAAVQHMLSLQAAQGLAGAGITGILGGVLGLGTLISTLADDSQNDGSESGGSEREDPPSPPINSPPVIGSPPSSKVDSNLTGAIHKIEASDNGSIALYELSGGADANIFDIDQNGNITFKSSVPVRGGSAAGTNDYGIEVKVTDNQGASVTQAVTISVEFPPDDGSAMGMVIQNNHAFLMAMGTGSRIEIHAADRDKTSWTQLKDPGIAGATSITVQQANRWEVGDQIFIASTARDWQEAEVRTITSISADGLTLYFDDPLQYSHRAESLYQNNGQTGEDYREWNKEIRAEVGLLSRNVVIQGDGDSELDGFGGHTMTMPGARMHIDGAEFFHMGQKDILGRYPLHWHLVDGGGEGQYVKNSSIYESFQKGITIHGTSRALVENNVLFDHIGHGVFFEDGGEIENLVLGNLVASTRRSETGLPILTDADHASSYWIENPNNTFIGNHAAGSQSNGFWIVPAAAVRGASAANGIGEVGQMAQLIFLHNVGHSSTGNPAGAGGQNQILGIDGRIKENTDFAQKTLQGDWAEIVGFTGYAGNLWSLTTQMVYKDLFLEDSRFFIRGENYVQDAWIREQSTGFEQLVLYRDGGNQLDDVLIENVQLLHQSTDHATTQNGLHNVHITGNYIPSFVGGKDAVEQQITIDLDGEISGKGQLSFITPSGPLGKFKTSPEGAYVAAAGGYVSLTTLGATEVTALNSTGLSILRSDGEMSTNHPISKDQTAANDFNNGHNNRSAANYEFITATGMAHDVAWLLDFDTYPETLTLNLTNVRQGESAVYEIPEIADHVMVTSDDLEVFSFEDLLVSSETSYFRDGNSGSLFIRIVATYLEVYNDRPVHDVLAAFRANDTITFEIDSGAPNTKAFADHVINADLRAAIAAQPERAIETVAEVTAPTRDPAEDYEIPAYASTSHTIDVTDSMKRWSNQDTWWGGKIIDEESVIVIGKGEIVILDQSVTVEGIIVNGGALIIEDDESKTIDLATDYLLVIGGGLFQAGTEHDPIDTEFTLTLEGDDPDFDLIIDTYLSGADQDVVFARNQYGFEDLI